MKISTFKAPNQNSILKKSMFLMLLIFISISTFAQASSEELSKNKYFIEYIKTMQKMNV